MDFLWSARADNRLGLSIAVGVLGFLFAGYLVGSLLATSNWNPTLLLKFGEADSSLVEYGRTYFEDLAVAPLNGHDGKYYFMQASDPLYLDPETHARFLDRPTYRAQRMFYPTIAGGFGLFPPMVTAWAMVIVNVIGVGLGSFVTSRLAQRLGISALFGLAFALNPGVFVSTFIDSAEVFAMAFLFAAIYALHRDRVVMAGIFMTCSVLSRETMILAAVGLLVFQWKRKAEFPLGLSTPFLAVGLWWVYVHLRIGYLDVGFQDTAALGLPFRGFVEAVISWSSGPGHFGDFVAGIFLMIVAFAVLYRSFKTRDLLGITTAGFSLVAFVMVEEVWGAYFDSTRVLAPLITAYLLMVPVESRRRLRSIEISTLTVPLNDFD